MELAGRADLVQFVLLHVLGEAVLHELQLLVVQLDGLVISVVPRHRDSNPTTPLPAATQHPALVTSLLIIHSSCNTTPSTSHVIGLIIHSSCNTTPSTSHIIGLIIHSSCKTTPSTSHVIVNHTLQLQHNTQH